MANWLGGAVVEWGVGEGIERDIGLQFNHSNDIVMCKELLYLLLSERAI